MDTSVRESYGGIPLQFYSVSYKRSQGLIHHISNLWENVQILLNSAEPLIKGLFLLYQELWLNSVYYQFSLSLISEFSIKIHLSSW